MQPTRLSPRLWLSTAKSPITLASQVPAQFAGAFVVLALAMLVAATTPPTASAQSVTYAGSGAVNFGSANVCPAGKTTPAPCSQTLTLTYNVTESGTLGTPKALTTGAPNLDYKVASGSTCTGSVTKGNKCTVNVTFAPKAPGARNGAVEIVDTSGNVLSLAYIYGTGTGPVLAFSPSALTQLGTASGKFSALAMDASGNIFATAFESSNVFEIPAAGGYTDERTLGSPGNGFSDPGAPAVDGAGNVFVGDNDELKEILAAGGYVTVKTLTTGSDYRGDSLAVDGSGNLLVADGYAVKELPAADGYTTVKTLASGFGVLTSIAVDGSGNVFVGDFDYHVVREILAAGGYTTAKILGSGFQEPAGLAVDASGNVYVADAESYLVNEIVADGGYTTVNTLSTPPSLPSGIALDPSGNVYVVGLFPGIVELPRSQPPLLAFEPTNVGTKSIRQSTTLQNIGNTDLVGTSISVSPNWYQVAGSGTPKDCTASFSLIPSAECNLSINFEPNEIGSLTGEATLTDNALNGTDATQSVPLSGTGGTSLPPEIISLNTTYAAPYAVVILNGANFGATQGSSTVTFNGVATPHYYWASNQIYVTVPPNATSGKLIVTVDGKPSNAVFFQVAPFPTITGISPTSGPVGTIVTISGHNLIQVEESTFNGKSLPIYNGDGYSYLQVVIPAGAVTGQFHIVVNDTGINTSTFTVTK